MSGPRSTDQRQPGSKTACAIDRLVEPDCLELRLRDVPDIIGSVEVLDLKAWHAPEYA